MPIGSFVTAFSSRPFPRFCEKIDEAFECSIEMGRMKILGRMKIFQEIGFHDDLSENNSSIMCNGFVLRVWRRRYTHTVAPS
jgi:hypothetical protein